MCDLRCMYLHGCVRRSRKYVFTCSRSFPAENLKYVCTCALQARWEVWQQACWCWEHFWAFSASSCFFASDLVVLSSRNCPSSADEHESVLESKAVSVCLFVSLPFIRLPSLWLRNRGITRTTRRNEFCLFAC